jgi:hypothetical protein
MEALAPGVHAATVPSDWGVDAQRRYVNATLGVESASRGNSSLRERYTDALMALMVVVGVV